MPDTNITWKELAPLLKTGDIVLVQGRQPFPGSHIQTYRKQFYTYGDGGAK